jgi:hypothetical protein
VTYSIRVTLQGETADVRDRLDDVLDVLHEFAVFVDRRRSVRLLRAL